jgi:hypothetical protein
MARAGFGAGFRSADWRRVRDRRGGVYCGGLACVGLRCPIPEWRSCRGSGEDFSLYEQGLTSLAIGMALLRSSQTGLVQSSLDEAEYWQEFNASSGRRAARGIVLIACGELIRVPANGGSALDGASRLVTFLLARCHPTRRLCGESANPKSQIPSKSGRKRIALISGGEPGSGRPPRWVSAGNVD